MSKALDEAVRLIEALPTLAEYQQRRREVGDDNIIVWEMDGGEPTWTFKRGHFTIYVERRPLGTWRIQLTEGDRLTVEHYCPSKADAATTITSIMQQIGDGTEPYKPFVRKGTKSSE